VKRELGVVTEFSDREGCGHIEADATGELVCVHFSQIQAEGFRALHAGERVEFTRVEMPDGPYAWNVIKLAGP
jgi:CspA family cold shock protein